MSSVNVSIILPEVSSAENFNRFCSSLFSCDLEIELLVCDNSGNFSVSDEYSQFVSVVSSDNKTEAINAAVYGAKGKFIMFSHDSIIYSPKAIEKLIVASAGRSAVCNIGIIDDGECQKAFTENFTAEDAAGKPIYFNHLLSSEIIRNNSLLFCGADTLSFMLFLADYYRYDNFTVFKEVLLYSDEVKGFTFDESLAYISEYANVFRLTGNSIATLFFISAVLSALLPSVNDKVFTVVKNVVKEFRDDKLLLSWIKARFAVDTEMLCDENVSVNDFKIEGESIYYKEVSLPIVPETVIRNFYSGKYGVLMLKKCIGAWIYYKFYCQKDGILKKYGCKLGRKLLGGDFVG